MAATASRTLLARFDGNTRGLEKATGRAQGALGRFQAHAARSSRGIGHAFATIGRAAAVGGAAVAAGALFAAPRLVDMAIGLDKLHRKATQVFGKQLPLIKKWAKENANAAGQSTAGYIANAAAIQDLLVPLGFARTKATSMTKTLLDLVPALADWNSAGLDATEVTGRLVKAMLGERDGLVELGIKISDAEIKEQLRKRGLDKLTGSALAQATAEITMQLAIAKSTDAQIAYARSSGSLGRRLEMAKAKLADMRDELIVRLTPALLTVATFLGDKVLPKLVRLADVLGRKDVDAVHKFGAAVNTVFAGLADRILRPVEAAMYGIAAGLKDLGRTLGPFGSGFTKLGNKAQGAANKVSNLRQEIADLGASLARSYTLRLNVPPPSSIAARRAHGGPVRAGRTYLVGEQGPELLTMGSSGGHVTPNSQLGGPVYVTVELDGAPIAARVRAEHRERDRSLKRAVTARAAP